MRIAFIGAHRTGKTTLANAVAERLGKPFVKTNVSDGHAQVGMTVKEMEQLTGFDGLLARIDFQENVLLPKVKKLYEENSDAVFDRSLIDVFAYSMSYCSKIVSEIGIDLKTLRSLNEHFLRMLAAPMKTPADRYIVISPGIDIKDVDTAASPELQLKVHTSVMDYCEGAIDDPIVMVIPNTVVNLDERIELCVKWLVST